MQDVGTQRLRVGQAMAACGHAGRQEHVDHTASAEAEASASTLQDVGSLPCLLASQGFHYKKYTESDGLKHFKNS